MTQEQKDWLADHPQFKPWRPHGAVSIYGWTGVGWLHGNGRFVPDGEPVGWLGVHAISSGGTLHIIPDDAVKVGHEYMIA